MVFKNPVVDSNKLERGEVWGETDSAVHWAGAFAVYGGHGATASSTIVYEVEPGKRLGWHTDATEERKYIIAGTGKLYLEDGSTWPVHPGSVFVLPTPSVAIGRTTARRPSRPRFFRLVPGLRPGDAAPTGHILGTPTQQPHHPAGLRRNSTQLVLGFAETLGRRPRVLFRRLT